MTEFDSWLQPTTADDYMQRLSVLYRRRKTAKVQGIVKRALAGGPVDGSDHTDDDLDARENQDHSIAE